MNNAYEECRKLKVSDSYDWKPPSRILVSTLFWPDLSLCAISASNKFAATLQSVSGNSSRELSCAASWFPRDWNEQRTLARPRACAQDVCKISPATRAMHGDRVPIDQPPRHRRRTTLQRPARWRRWANIKNEERENPQPRPRDWCGTLRFAACGSFPSLKSVGPHVSELFLRGSPHFLRLQKCVTETFVTKCGAAITVMQRQAGSYLN